VIVPADRVSTHDLPLAETLSVVERELFHTMSVGPIRMTIIIIIIIRKGAS